jgi:23S rRNA (cytosine1962-C5)-methyltransferase
MLKVYLKRGREKPLLGGHPWIFSGAIRKVEGNGGKGEHCVVLDDGGRVVGQGYFNARSSIAVRMLTFGSEPFTRMILEKRLERAAAAREGIARKGTTDSYRLVNTEGDFLPGLIVDRYADGIVIQINTAGMDRMRSAVIESLAARFIPRFIFERCDSDARTREGLGSEEGLRSGDTAASSVIKENGLLFEVDIKEGHKTGYYFDQRENRALARAYAPGMRCLDCFSYCGAFAMNLLAGKALSVTAVDISKKAVEWCRRNLALNDMDGSGLETVCADAFDYLRAAGKSYDLVVLDPPKFARHPSEAAGAARGYKEINRAAMKITANGGLLFTFSCSSAVDAHLFRQIVCAAAADAGRQAQLLHVLSAGPDHPVSISHPEGEYLKGLALRVH